MKPVRYIIALLFAVAFFVFVYNSGYGYDAIEYIVIGNSLLDGFSVFEFSPSKSPGIYYVVAGFLKWLPDSGHLEISALITIILLIILAATYGIVRASHGPDAAFASAALLALSACFMEMNFLETEGFVFLFALPALPFLRDGLRKDSLIRFALAGFCIGAAAFFKSVALFYLPGATVFVLGWGLLRMRASLSKMIRSCIAMWGGTLAALLLPAIFYLARGEFGPYLHWTYVFPVLHYEPDTLYLSKLAIKLSWFWTLLVLSLLLSLHPRVRAAFVMSLYPTASLAMGLTALFPPLKNQASHYVFPAAGFLCIFMALTWSAFAEAHPNSRRVLPAALAAFAILALGSVYFYRPTVLRRLFRLRDYREETALAERLQMLVRPDERMLCMSHPLPYWLARRYPAIPTVNLHVQFVHLIRNNPSLLMDALNNPALVLVEFDPQYFSFRAPSLKNDPWALDLHRAFAAALAARFHRVEIPESRFTFWVRRPPRDLL